MHTVYIDRGDHWEVIANYSGSRRHAALSALEWEFEYASGGAYSSMRADHAGSLAGITTQGVGRWKKDWSGPYVSNLAKLSVSSSQPADFDGVPSVAADGVAVHVILVKKVDQARNDIRSGNEPLRILPSAPVPISTGRAALANGSVSVIVGPCERPCDVEIKVADPSGVMKSAGIKIRFG